MRNENETVAGQPRKAVVSRKPPEVRRRLLIEAGKRCLGKGGIRAFTLENICREAGVTLSLISYYFGSKHDFLAAVYEASLYELPEEPLANAENEAQAADALCRLIDLNFGPEYYSRDVFRLWLALWDEQPQNRKFARKFAALEMQHRTRISALVAQLARFRGLDIDADVVARKTEAVLNGLWLEYCLYPAIRKEDMRDAAYEYLEFHLGRFRPARGATQTGTF